MRAGCKEEFRYTLALNTIGPGKLVAGQTNGVFFMKPGYHLVNWIMRRVLSAVYRVDASQLYRIPRQGPALAVANHVTLFEAPIMIAWLDNPLVTGISKRENWKNPLIRFLFWQWEVIPIDRGLVDRDAFNQSVEALKRGKILAIAPEGTRSKSGAMQQGKAGVTILAARSGAPIVPIAYWGHENFWSNLKHLRRTDFHVAVGQPLRLTAEGAGLSREVREAATNEVMYKIAELLPEAYRGFYAFDKPVEYRYLVPAE